MECRKSPNIFSAFAVVAEPAKIRQVDFLSRQIRARERKSSSMYVQILQASNLSQVLYQTVKTDWYTDFAVSPLAFVHRRLQIKFLQGRVLSR